MHVLRSSKCDRIKIKLTLSTFTVLYRSILALYVVVCVQMEFQYSVKQLLLVLSQTTQLYIHKYDLFCMYFSFSWNNSAVLSGVLLPCALWIYRPIKQAINAVSVNYNPAVVAQVMTQ